MDTQFNDLKSQPTVELIRRASELRVEKATSLPRQELIFEIQRMRMRSNGVYRTSGLLEVLPDGFGFLRSPEGHLLPGPDDVYVSPSQIRRFHLRDGDLVQGRFRAPKDAERYFALIKVEAINGEDPESGPPPVIFSNRTVRLPETAWQLQGEDPVARLISSFVPLGRGDRALVVAPPRGGASSFVESLCRAVQAGGALQTKGDRPRTQVVSLHIQERPEHLACLAREAPWTVLGSTFDEPTARHLQVANLVHQRCLRLVEQGLDVLLAVDSLTRLGQACLEAADESAPRHHPDLTPLRHLLASARNLEGRGSLTVVGILVHPAEVEPHRRITDAIAGYETVRYTLHRDLLASGHWPPLLPAASWNRRASVLLPPEEAEALATLRQQFSHRGIPRGSKEGNQDEIRETGRVSSVQDGARDLERLWQALRSWRTETPLDNAVSMGE